MAIIDDDISDMIETSVSERRTSTFRSLHFAVFGAGLVCIGRDRDNTNAGFVYDDFLRQD